MTCTCRMITVKSKISRESRRWMTALQLDWRKIIVTVKSKRSESNHSTPTDRTPASCIPCKKLWHGWKHGFCQQWPENWGVAPGVLQPISNRVLCGILWVPECQNPFQTWASNWTSGSLGVKKACGEKSTKLIGGFLMRKDWNFKSCMLPNYGHWFTDFRTVFVFALGPFLPMFVILAIFGHFWPSCHQAMGDQ